MKIKLINSQVTLNYDPKYSLLENLEKCGFHPEYQCRIGFCGCCRIKLKKGKVSYTSLPLAFFQKNEILACCCKVEENLEIEF